VTSLTALQAFLERIARDFLSTFTCSAFLASQLQPLAESTIQRSGLHPTICNVHPPLQVRAAEQSRPPAWVRRRDAARL
jgi:hypothetical protein